MPSIRRILIVAFSITAGSVWDKAEAAAPELTLVGSSSTDCRTARPPAGPPDPLAARPPELSPVCPPVQQSAAAEIRQLQDQLIQAYKQRDVATIDRILADDYVFTTSDGQFLRKGQLMSQFRTGGDRTITSYVIDDASVQIHGTAAVLTYRYTSKEQYQGKEEGGQMRMTRMLVKQDGRWRMIAAHESRIPGNERVRGN